MDFRTIKEAELKDKRVIVRCDLDVPLAGGNIVDDTRLQLSVATIKHIILKEAKQVIIIGHVGRPKGEPNKSLTTNNIAKRLEELIKDKVIYIPMYERPTIPDDKIVVLENLRFSPKERDDDEEFAKDLAELGDVFINDAFAVAHRKHASTSAITKFLPSYAGFNLEHEFKTLRDAIIDPEHPFAVIIGGAKLETKIPVIRNLLPKVDKILLGGAMIFSFYKSLGFDVGRSIINDEAIALAKETLESSKDKIILPEDVVVADNVKVPDNILTVQYNQIPSEYTGLDIGPASVEEFRHALEGFKTVIWNGTIGMFENEEFAKGTEGVAKILADLEATTIAGGGDTAAAISKLGLADKFTHVSTGGGASLTLLAGKELPAITALVENAKNF